MRILGQRRRRRVRKVEEGTDQPSDENVSEKVDIYKTVKPAIQFRQGHFLPFGQVV